MSIWTKNPLTMTRDEKIRRMQLLAKDYPIKIHASNGRFWWTHYMGFNSANTLEQAIESAIWQRENANRV